MIAQTKRVTLPAEWASALISFDYSGLEFYQPESARECRKVSARLCVDGWNVIDVDSEDKFRGTARYTLQRAKCAIRFTQVERRAMAGWHGGQASALYAAQSAGGVPMVESAVRGVPDYDQTADELWWLWRELDYARDCAVRGNDADWRTLARLCQRVYAARERMVARAESAD